tara:strand:+ start:876 stop:1115 length:240 start_codon:yes stop_codon:yes gene_type:complete
MEKIYFNNLKKNYIENIVYPYNYSLLSTAIIRNNLKNKEIEKLHNYSIDYWNNYISKKRKNQWINYFIDKKLFTKIKID